MPTYLYSCVNCGATFERYLPLSQYRSPQTCECGTIATKQLTPPMIFVSPEIHYTSPIDGREITSREARMDDLRRNDCIEYDPEMRKDFDRKLKEQDAAIERSFDETVEREVAAMPPRQMEKLAAEVAGGLTCEPIRGTAPLKPIKTQLMRG